MPGLRGPPETGDLSNVRVESPGGGRAYHGVCVGDARVLGGWRTSGGGRILFDRERLPARDAVPLRVFALPAPADVGRIVLGVPGRAERSARRLELPGRPLRAGAAALGQDRSWAATGAVAGRGDSDICTHEGTMNADGLHPCDVCGWQGVRAEREVNYSQMFSMWICRRCFFLGEL